MANPFDDEDDVVDGNPFGDDSPTPELKSSGGYGTKLFAANAPPQNEYNPNAYNDSNQYSPQTAISSRNADDMNEYRPPIVDTSTNYNNTNTYAISSSPEAPPTIVQPNIPVSVPLTANKRIQPLQRRGDESAPSTEGSISPHGSVGSVNSMNIKTTTTSPVVVKALLTTTNPGKEDFEKLRHEYVQTRQNLSSLKRYMVQEMDKTKTLDVALKSEHGKLMSAMEQIDRLQFRNDTLAKRMSVLQKDFEEARRKSGGGWFSGGSRKERQEAERLQESLEVAQEAFEHKLRENQAMSLKFLDAKKEHQEAVDIIQQKMERVKRDLVQKSDEMSLQKQSYEEQIQLIVNEKVDLNNQLKNLEASLQKTKEFMERREQAMTRTQENLTTQLATAQRIIDSKIIFNDTADNALNRLNMPPHDRETEILTRNVMKKNWVLLQDFLTAFIGYCRLHQSRLLIENTSHSVPEKQRQVNLQIRERLSEMITHLTTLGSAFDLIMESFEKGKPALDANKHQFLQALRLFVEEDSRLLQYREIRTKNDAARCGPETKKSLQKLFTSYQTLHTILDNMYKQASKYFNGDHMDQVYALSQIHSCTNTIVRIMQDISSGLVTYSMAHSDPSTEEQMRKNDKLFLASWTKLIVSLEEIESVLERIISLKSSTKTIFIKGTKMNREDVDDSVISIFKENAVNFLNRLAQVQTTVSIPYNTQIEHAKRMKSLDEEAAKIDAKVAIVQESLESSKADNLTLRSQLSQVKDELAAKKSKINSLLAQLAKLRLNPPVVQQAPPPEEPQNTEGEVNLLDLDFPMDEDMNGTPTLLRTGDLDSDVPENDAVELPDEPLESNHQPGLLIDAGLLAPQAPEQTVNDPIEKPKREGNKKWSMSVFDEHGEQDTLKLPEQDKEREDKMKAHFQDKIKHLTTQMQQMDVKVVELHKAKTLAEGQLRTVTVERDAQKEYIESLNRKLKQAQGDLESTKNNYDQQMKVMSEHFLALNDKIALYKEQIQMLQGNNRRTRR